MSEGNFRVRAIRGNGAFCRYFRSGKSYKVLDGVLTDEGGYKWDNNGNGYKNIYELNNQFDEKKGLTNFTFGEFDLVEDIKSETKLITVEVSVEKSN